MVTYYIVFASHILVNYYALLVMSYFYFVTGSAVQVGINLSFKASKSAESDSFITKTNVFD